MVIVMQAKSVSKSKMKAKALEYFREVERTGCGIVITDRGRPVLRLVPYRAEVDPPASMLRETVVRYDDPTLPVGEEDWELMD